MLDKYKLLNMSSSENKDIIIIIIIKPRRVRPKTIIKLQPTISSFTSKPPLSLRPEPPPCN